MRRKWLFGCLLLAIPFLAGSKCVFVFSSGDSDPRPQDPNDVSVQAKQGHLIGEPVRGIAYKSGSLSGVTGERGEFAYEEGQTVRFFIGDISLGNEVIARELMTPIDLVEGGSPDHPTVINIARLLKSLDAIQGDDVITIPSTVHRDAVTANSTIFWALESLDFEDEQAFVNAASTLVAVLTRDYPFTATLIDADTARENMLDAIKSWNSQQKAANH